MAVVPLEADKSQPGTVMDQPGQCQRRLARFDAAAAHADIHLHQHSERAAVRLADARQITNVSRVVHADLDHCPRGQTRQSFQLDRSHDLIGDEQVRKPCVGQDFRLVQLRA